MNDKLGDRLKALEQVEAGRALNEDMPILARLDGKAFHTFTKGLQRPYDKRFISCMQETCKFLIEKTHAKIGYVQSDEISLVYFKEEAQQQTFFNGKIQKLTSVLASMATAKFNECLQKHVPEKQNILAFFDCRVWNVENIELVNDVLVWRQEDAIKNSISMLAQAFYSPKELMHKNSPVKLELLKEKGIIWDEQPTHFKMGSFWGRITTLEPIPPELKDFHPNEDKFLRSEIQELILPRLKNTTEQNKLIWQHIEDNKALQEIYKNKKKTKNGI